MIPTNCEKCGALLPAQPARGSVRRFCSEQHRRSAEKRRWKQRNPAALAKQKQRQGVRQRLLWWATRRAANENFLVGRMTP